MTDAAPYSGARLLLLGAAGFIGRWVGRALSRAGADLHVAVRDPAAFRSIAARFEIRADVHVADLAQPAEAAAIVRELRPACVFNLAGYGVDPTERDDALAEKLNRDLPCALASALLETPPACAWPARRLVQAGSALEYGPVDGPVTEAGPEAPTTVYGRTKLAGALCLRDAAAHGLRSVEGRIFTAYGPGEHAPRLLPSLLRAVRGGDEIPLTSGDQQRDFIQVEDVAEALLRLGRVEAEGFAVVNVATGTLHSVRAFVEQAAAVLGLDAARLAFGTLPYRKEEMWHGPVSIGRLAEETGWQPGLDLRQGLIRTASFEGLGSDDLGSDERKGPE